MDIHKFKVGDIVQSNYHSPWYGRVVHVQKRKEWADLVTVQPFFTGHLQPYKKRQKQHVLDEGYLKKIDDIHLQDLRDRVEHFQEALFYSR